MEIEPSTYGEHRVPMTIGHLTASASRQAGGLFDAVRRLAGELAQLPGISLRAFALEDVHTQADRSAWNGVSVTAVPVRGPRSFGYAPKLLRHVAAAQPDLLHQHGLWMYPSIVCRQWSTRTRKPYIVSPHGMLDQWALRNSRWKKRLASFLYEAPHLQSAACLHALCAAEARAFRAYGLKNPICILPNGVDLPGVPRVRTDNEARSVLYLGRLHPKKNLLNLLRAWAALQREATALEWRLVVAGWDQGGYEDQLKRMAKELGVEGRVFFAGPKFGEEKDATFRGADAFVLPSHSEGLPITVLEAWSYGLPIVMTPECNLPEGFTTDAAIRIGLDPAEIAGGLRELFSLGDSERRVMGENGLKLVREKFSWPDLAQRMKTVYEWVLGGSKPNTVEIPD